MQNKDNFSFRYIFPNIEKTEGWLSEQEAHLLYIMAKHGKGKGLIVEIGSWMGKSTIALAAGSKSANREKVYAVDPHEGIYSGQKKYDKRSTLPIFLENLKKVHLSDWVIPIVKTSKEAEKNWNKKVRLLFIDGLHDFKHVHLDYILWERHLTPGGFIAFHDAYWGWDGPRKVILEEVLRNNNFSGFGVIGSIIYCKKKRVSSFLEKLDRIRFQFILPIILKLHNIPMQKDIKYHFLHKPLKYLLLNRDTFNLT